MGLFYLLAGKRLSLKLTISGYLILSSMLGNVAQNLILVAFQSCGMIRHILAFLKVSLTKLKGTLVTVCFYGCHATYST